MISVIRAINQLISYEINITIILVSIFYLSKSFNFGGILLAHIDFTNFNPLFFILFISLLAES